MTKRLPDKFVEKMKDLLGEAEFAQFLASYEEPRAYGLRANPLKIERSDFLEAVPFELEAVPWAAEGFYYGEGERPGKHPYYHAGLYYIQEPSAMAPADLLDVQPGDKVLDLCAAPGGKSTQIAGKLQGQGLLVSNDINAERVKALVRNLELFGVRNGVVLNEKPEKLMSTFRDYFDKIVIDAPCSGEGMFRKEEEMAIHWERNTIAMFNRMQEELLGQAAAMLAPGGRLVYSTCTFSPEENEAQIAAFLDKHDDFYIVPIDRFAPGRPEWLREPWCPGAFSDEARQAVAGTGRLWPHKLRGEGHYVAVLGRRGAGDGAPVVGGAVAVEADSASLAVKPGGGGRRDRRGGSLKGRAAAPARAEVSLEPLEAFAGELLRGEPFAPGRLLCYGDHAYLSPLGLPELHGLKVVRPGWYIGALHRGRFEPSQALALGLRGGEAKRVLRLALDDARALRYLRGETLEIAEDEILREDGQAAKGYCLVCLDGHPVGWGKWIDGILKNEYPPAWRWT
ncbi:RsmB/NOP family class I SAM-dependent RNA methyltransferase [Paenibacillus ferrarius]|uniref:RsmB/NOP family class I SAM-dependent RNA methyltransferase n=1 Tax=Paenibacillus ferrarius TaxID=1469647 RepID=UPI003D2825B7